MSTYWKNWSEINKLSLEKKAIYFYGRSEDWVHKAVKSVNSKIEGIIDRNLDYAGSQYLGLLVMPFESLENIKDYFFIITAGEFDGIVETLEDAGLIAGLDFACSPDFYDYNHVRNFSNTNAQFIISSSDYNDTSRARSSKVGGGLFFFDTSEGALIKKASGSYRQIEIVGDKIYAVEYVDGHLDVFDMHFNHISRIPLPGSNLCGLAHDPKTNKFFIANAGTDEILCYDLSCGRVSVLKHFVRSGTKREAHVNDLCFDNDKLFVSYFSASGNYKYGVFDGGVSVVDLKNDSTPVELISGLWKPHSPRTLSGYLYVLDSMRGELRTGKPKQHFNFSGFVRGLDKLNNHIAVGQSQDMYISEHVGTGRTISIDAGVYLCEEHNKLQKFFSMPGIMNIHDLRILNVY
jgi:hypothetical protein